MKDTYKKVQRYNFIFKLISNSKLKRKKKIINFWNNIKKNPVSFGNPIEK